MIQKVRYVGTTTSDTAGNSAYRGGYDAAKRGIDVILAGLGLVALAPVLVFVALWVRVDSSGPVIYRQRRIGRDGREFVLFKFRTMLSGTPALPTDVMVRQSVSPITRSGRILRRTSLDELPQLVNVLRGEMSLIGPRPALPCQTDLNAARRVAGIESLRPGITGWAQVCGRDDLSDAAKVACDSYYRTHLSVWMDLRIVVRTIGAVFTARGSH